jgi:xylulose-5-phosphate/fructose-6-phosphate phosphoketolase
MAVETRAPVAESGKAASLSPDKVAALDAYWRAANYLGAAQVYLQANFLLEEPLRPEHIKPRLLGHWGTVPGINFVYAHLNRLIRTEDASILLITGPGHGAPANLANLYLEGSLAEFYPEYAHGRDGLGRLVRAFSWPGGFPSHLTPGTPGTIHEGGELGYALATAFGAAFDNPDLIVACVVGDGEAETGPTATAWHSTKFLNPATDGAVLPILHLNGYKISSRTVYGSMSEDELRALFTGYGYEPLFVDTPANPDDREGAHHRMAAALDSAYRSIRAIQEAARDGRPVEKPRWPVVVFRSPKGWTGIRELDGEPVEGSYRSHQVPTDDVRKSPEHLRALEGWLRSYRPAELFDAAGRPVREILATCPRGEQRMGMNPHAYGGNLRKELRRPDFKAFAVPVRERGAERRADTKELAKYLAEVVRLDGADANFRVVCPDEMSSNRLDAVFGATRREFEWPTDPHDEGIGPRGRVLEILSEHTCQAWLQGYLLSGRHGLFPCYEAFVSIIDSMMGQYAKFLKQSEEIPWRKPVSSFTYLLSSEGWRQDHNGYSHQMPGFINTLLNKKARNVRIYLPPDANCLLSTLDHCLTSTDKINLVIASKQPMPQWLPVAEADAHCRAGASVWEWAGHAGANPDVVLVCSGVYPTAEVLAAAWHLRRDLPELRVRVVSVTDLLILEPDTYHPHGLTPERFDELFTPDRPVVYNFHGYPSAVEQLLFHRPRNGRFTVNGYREEGTTTTPFTLLAMNGVDRYHVLVQAVRAAAPGNPAVAAKADRLIDRYEGKLAAARAFAEEHGEDPPEITAWAWTAE